jgi:membrane associated rhomboid family serine protease
MNNVLYLVIAVNVIFSIQGFNNAQFMDRYIFSVGKIRWGKEYIRLISSGFLHANWGHLLFNMMTLFFFGGTMVSVLGPFQFVFLYMVSLLGGNVLALYIKRDDANYRALGASGAVSGVLYAFILPFPWEKIYLFFIPIGIPAWIFGIMFIAISIYGVRSNVGNIGHEAHLGGAITGLIAMIALRPNLFIQNWEIGLAILAPTIIFLYLIIKRPDILRIGQKDDWKRWD